MNEWFFPLVLLAVLEGLWCTSAQAAEPTDASELLRFHNHVRQRHGQEPLQLHDKLTKAAESHAAYLVSTSYWKGHIGPPGARWPADRVKNAGYAASSSGENVASDFATPASAMRAWLHSPGHTRNLLGDWRDCGFAIGRRNGKPYCYVSVFANPRSALRHVLPQKGD